MGIGSPSARETRQCYCPQHVDIGDGPHSSGSALAAENKSIFSDIIDHAAWRRGDAVTRPYWRTEDDSKFRTLLLTGSAIALDADLIMPASAYAGPDALCSIGTDPCAPSARKEIGSMPVRTDPVEEVFTPEQKREITKLVTEAMIAFESEAIPSITWLNIMQAVRSADRRPRHKWRRASHKRNSA